MIVNMSPRRFQAEHARIIRETSLKHYASVGIVYYVGADDGEESPPWVARPISNGRWLSRDWIGLGKTPEEALKDLERDLLLNPMPLLEAR